MHRLRAVFSELQQGAATPGSGAGNCAAAEQVSGNQIAAGTGAVRNHLREGPIEISRVCGRQAVYRFSFRRQGGSQKRRFQFNIERACLLVTIVP